MIFALGNHRRAARRAHRRPAGEGIRHRADHHRQRRGLAGLRPSPCRSHPATTRSGSSSSAGSSAASASSSTTSTRSAFARRSRPTVCMGRMNATMRLIVWGTIPIGALIGGIPRRRVRAQCPSLWVSAIGAIPRLPPGPLLAGADAARDPGPGRMTLAAPMRCSALAEELGEPHHRHRRPAPSLAAARGPIGVGQRCRRRRLGAELAGDGEGASACASAHPATRGRPRRPIRCAARSWSIPRPARWPCGHSALRSLDLRPSPRCPLDEFGAHHDRPDLPGLHERKARRVLRAPRAGADDRPRRRTTPNKRGSAPTSGAIGSPATSSCLPARHRLWPRAADDGARLADPYLAGPLDPDLLAAVPRGQRRPRWRKWSSGARLGLMGVDDLRLVAAGVDGDRATVTSPARMPWSTGSSSAPRLEPPRATSCRADEVEAPIHWSVVAP